MATLYYKRLDVLRLIAFSLVFWQHGFANCFNQHTGNFYLDQFIYVFTNTGPLGVHLFFVISGFLITHLLLKEYSANNRVNVIFFYTRRILRIWPLYYLILISGIFILPHFFSAFQFCGSKVLNLLFLNNFDIDSKCYSPNVDVSWSVAIEEQFYLLWPLIFVFTARNRNYLLLVSVVLFLTSVLFFLHESSINLKEAYYHTLSNVNFLMMGCIGAILYFHEKIKARISKYLSFKVVITCAFFIALLLYTQSVSFFFYPITAFLLPLLLLALVIYCVYNQSDFRKFNFLSVLGKYTYGMYLYHPIFIMFTKILFDKLKLDYRNDILLNIPLGFVSLGATILISVLSYEYFEKFFLNLKKKISFIQTRV